MTDSIAATNNSIVDWIAPAAGSTPPELDPFDRMVLTADGTVTTLLEACTDEQIVTRATRQAGPASIDRLLMATGRWWHPDDGLLDLAPMDRLIVRRVSLRGASSGVAYVLAESLVVPDRLPAAIAERLHRDGASLGRLLAAGRTHRRSKSLGSTAQRAIAAQHNPADPENPLEQRRHPARPATTSGPQTRSSKPPAPTMTPTTTTYGRNAAGTTPSAPLRCGHCGWPLEDTPALSIHRTSEGPISYRRCVCGRISLERSGTVLGGAGPPTPRSRRQVGMVSRP